MKKRSLSFAKTSFALLLSSILGFSALPSAHAGPVTSYNGGFSLTSSDSTPVLKPLWTKTADIGGAQRLDTFYAQTADGLVFYPAKGKLFAVEASTGRQKWSVNAKLGSEMVVGSGTIYFIDNSGSLVGLNAKTGGVLWKTKTGITARYGTYNLALSGGKLIVGSTETLHAYDTATGKRLWKQSTEAVEGGTVYGTYDGVLVASSVVSGAIMVDQYIGYDIKTGKQLWALGGSYAPLLEQRGGYLYLRDNSMWANQDYAAIVDKVSVKTGKKAASYSFAQVQDGMYQQADQVIIDGKYIYVSMQKYIPNVLQGYSSILYRYELDKDPKTQKPVAYEDHGDLLAGPYMDRFFFQRGLQLSYMKFAGQASTSYPEIHNPVSRLDLHGTGIYTGLSDGLFYLIDIPSAKTLGRIDTGGRVYGETLFSDDTVIVQAENKLIAVKRPSALTDKAQ
ncbi:PQQ-binding-like beta-propeller repeat protein [Saccharibacillus sp. CPCC 101409]|uniref:outer membrane protein assembly factor BamB family protein n=1 Tax=Saccharibacillus sp. CPCC 101409 TaxID=3058041 RepID=UPI002672AAB9|nr:PQQ-binding-like beta-propeller repeat protein [Saccharibacillus sp. CPCC 101409]MDO3412249.1 PQQ-binding-like beta-propeller repeat protein [Saccharibacillus sp. CPCC 101409]